MSKFLKSPMFNGIMLGLIVPIIVFFIWHQLKYSAMDLSGFIDMTLTKVHVPATIRMCVFANLPLFLLYNFAQKFEVCIGIFISSMFYIIVMAGFYFFG